MKKQLFLSIILLLIAISSCNKEEATPQTQKSVHANEINLFGPYGKESAWKSVGGDTIFSDTLTLSFFYTEKASPCDICYYQQSYSLWNDYDYTLSASKCSLPNDSLTITDFNTNAKAIFIQIK